MRKSQASKILALAMTCAMLLGMVACSAPTPAATTAPAASVAPSTAPSAEPSAPAVDNKPIVLQMVEHANQGSNDAVKALNAAFTKQYPNITINDTIGDDTQSAQLVQTGIAAGTIDIFELNCFGITIPDWAKGVPPGVNLQYIQAGDVLDLTGQPFLANWEPAALRDACTYDGKVYCLDIGKVAYNGVFYSKAIFAKYNLQVPQTWDQFVTLCKTLQANGVAPMTSGGKEGWPPWMMWNGFINAFEPDPAGFAKALWTGERKFNDPQTLKLFDKMAEFASFYEKGVMSVDEATATSRFVAGKAAMLQDGTWQCAAIDAADPTFQYGYFCLPGDTQGAQPQQLAGKYDIGYAGYAKSPNTDAILKWMAFLSQKENYTSFINTVGFIPTMDVTVTNPFINSLAPMNVNFQINYEILNHNPTGLGKYGQPFDIADLTVMGGSIATTKELADLAQADWDAALKAVNSAK